MQRTKRRSLVFYVYTCIHSGLAMFPEVKGIACSRLAAKTKVLIPPLHTIAKAVQTTNIAWEALHPFIKELMVNTGTAGYC